MIASIDIEKKYWSIQLQALRTDSILDFDLYLDNGSEIVLYRSASQPFGEKTKAMLIEGGVDHLLIPLDDQQNYQTYVEKHISEIISDSSIDCLARSEIIYNTTQLLVKDVLANPELGENIKRAQSMVENSVGFILRDPEAFSSLLEVMSFDYKLYTHSVNVCTFSIALARFMGLNDEESLNELGIGALLLDVGKIRISPDILDKHSALTEEEFEIVKRHPLWGEEIVRKTDLVPRNSYFPIAQHHEREDGSGYPFGLKGGDIHEYSKIVAIADVFDAMTTRRCYRNAVETFPALMIMFGERGQFDVRLLENFTTLMGPKKLVGN